MALETPGMQTQVLSRINEAGNQVIRIGMLWHDANEAAATSDFKKWNGKLERIWSELSADSTEEQMKEFTEINNDLAKLLLNFNYSNVPKNKWPPSFYKLIDQQYKKLMEKDYFLRTLQNAQGKGTLYKDEFEDDFE